MGSGQSKQKYDITDIVPYEGQGTRVEVNPARHDRAIFPAEFDVRIGVHGFKTRGNLCMTGTKVHLNGFTFASTFTTGAILNTTSDFNSPALAISEKKSVKEAFRSAVYVTIRAHGKDYRAQISFKKRNLLTWFDSPIIRHDGSSSDSYVERFEWRKTRGEEVKKMGHRSGHKLVRLDDPTVYDNGEQESTRSGGSSNSSSSSSASPEASKTSDNHEVVALWVGGTIKSMTKQGSFKFVGRGATGELGSAWEIMAVMSALARIQRTLEHAAASS